MKNYLSAIGLAGLLIISACESDRRVADGRGYDGDNEFGSEPLMEENDGPENDSESGTEDISLLLTRAAGGSLLEVELGQLAAEKAAHPQVKQFAQMVTQEHRQIQEQLQSLGRELNTPVPSQLNANQQQTLQKLQQLSGDEFDREYVAFLVEEHRKDIEWYQELETKVQEDKVQQFVNSTLAVLQQHQQQIQELKAQLAN